MGSINMVNADRSELLLGYPTLDLNKYDKHNRFKDYNDFVKALKLVPFIKDKKQYENPMEHYSTIFSLDLDKLPVNDVHTAIAVRIFARAINLHDWNYILSKDHRNDEEIIERCKNSVFYDLITYILDEFEA